MARAGSLRPWTRRHRRPTSAGASGPRRARCGRDGRVDFVRRRAHVTCAACVDREAESLDGLPHRDRARDVDRHRMAAVLRKFRRRAPDCQCVSLDRGAFGRTGIAPACRDGPPRAAHRCTGIGVFSDRLTRRGTRPPQRIRFRAMHGTTTWASACGPTSSAGAAPRSSSSPSGGRRTRSGRNEAPQGCRGGCIGQFAASLGLVIYSYLLDNIVFVVSNLFLLAIASVGQWLSCVTGNAKNSTRKRWREWAA